MEIINYEKRIEIICKNLSIALQNFNDISYFRNFCEFTEKGKIRGILIYDNADHPNLPMINCSELLQTITKLVINGENKLYIDDKTSHCKITMAEIQLSVIPEEARLRCTKNTSIFLCVSRPNNQSWIELLYFNKI